MIERTEVKMKRGERLVHYMRDDWEVMAKIDKDGTEHIFLATPTKEDAKDGPKVENVENSEDYAAILRFQSFNEPLYI